jgi:hypothetical protein
MTQYQTIKHKFQPNSCEAINYLRIKVEVNSCGGCYCCNPCNRRCNCMRNHKEPAASPHFWRHLVKGIIFVIRVIHVMVDVII